MSIGTCNHCHGFLGKCECVVAQPKKQDPQPPNISPEMRQFLNSLTRRELEQFNAGFHKVSREELAADRDAILADRNRLEIERDALKAELEALKESIKTAQFVVEVDEFPGHDKYVRERASKQLADFLRNENLMRVLSSKGRPAFDEDGVVRYVFEVKVVKP